MSWISLKDRLPDKLQTVLTWDIQRGRGTGYWYEVESASSGECWRINGRSGGYGTQSWVFPPTHWMPLPPPPNSKEHTELLTRLEDVEGLAKVISNEIELLDDWRDSSKALARAVITYIKEGRGK